MELTLEVIMVPSSDLDRSKTFYEDGCGFKVDLDQEVAPGIRIIQLTPPGSRCSIALSSGMPDRPDQQAMTPGSLQGLQLCVTDIAAAHAALTGRSVPVSAIQHVGRGAGRTARARNGTRSCSSRTRTATAGWSRRHRHHSRNADSVGRVSACGAAGAVSRFRSAEGAVAAVAVLERVGAGCDRDGGKRQGQHRRQSVGDEGRRVVDRVGGQRRGEGTAYGAGLDAAFQPGGHGRGEAADVPRREQEPGAWARRPGTAQAATPSSEQVRWTNSQTAGSRRQGARAALNSRT